MTFHGTFMDYQNSRILAASTLATGQFLIIFAANPRGGLGLAIFTETGVSGAFFLGRSEFKSL